MKKITKRVLAVVLLGVMIFSLTACGVDMSKIKGDWTLSTVGGKSLEEYAAASGVGVWATMTNYNITDDKITTDILNPDGSGSHMSTSLTLKKRSNGVEGYSGDTLACSLIYDEKADTLTMKMGADEASAIAFVFKKGKADLDGALQAAMGGNTEEGSDEGYSEEESYEEE